MRANDTSLFQNRKVNIDTSIEGLARLVKGEPPAWLSDGLREIQSDLNAFESDCKNESGVEGAHKLAPIYRQTLDLYARVKASDLNAEAKAGLELELGAKIAQFQTALKDLLGAGPDRFHDSWTGRPGGGRDAADRRTRRRAACGRARSFGVRVHVAQGNGRGAAESCLAGEQRRRAVED